MPHIYNLLKENICKQIKKGETTENKHFEYMVFVKVKMGNSTHLSTILNYSVKFKEITIQQSTQKNISFFSVNTYV